MKFNLAATAMYAGTALAAVVAPMGTSAVDVEHIAPLSLKDGVSIEAGQEPPAVQAARAARAEIAKIIQEADVNLAAKFVRQGFHDCVGGCDGCIDLSNGDNAGLEVPIAALDPVVEKYAGPTFTRADIWALAALEGARGSQPPGSPDNRDFSMDFVGRPNCEDLNDAADCVDDSCAQDRGPDRHLPSPDLSTHDLVAFYADNFGFDDRDTVAIMGAHTLGGLARENSGFDGENGWLGDTETLNSGYYNGLVGPSEEALEDGGNWQQVFVDNAEIGTPSRWEWESPDPSNQGVHYVMTSSDMAIVRDFAGQIDEDGQVSCSFKRENACPNASTLGISAEYKFDNALWLEEFEDAFKRMLLTGQGRATSVTRSLGALRGGQD